MVDYKPLNDTDFVFGISAKKSLSKNLIFRYHSQSKWEKSDGTFLTNLTVGYDKTAIPITDNNSTEHHTESEIEENLENKFYFVE